MTVTDWIQIIMLIAVLTLLTPLLGGYMPRVYRRERVGLAYFAGPVERLLYRAVRVDEEKEQRWVQYAGSLLLFSAASWLALCVILRTQRVEPVPRWPATRDSSDPSPATWDRTGSPSRISRVAWS